MRGDGIVAKGFFQRVFQSTPLHEGRRWINRTLQGVACFNPRPCMRGDVGQQVGLKVQGRFNPRPCMRGDSVHNRLNKFRAVSIHAPA